MKPLLVIDFVAEGHHPSHIVHLLKFLYRHQRRDVGFLIPRALYEAAASRLSPEETQFFRGCVRFLENEPAWIRLAGWFKSKSLLQRLYVEYLNLFETGRSNLLYLYLESVIYQTALSPVPRFGTSGLMFRATYYYRERKMLSPGLKNRALFLLKWLVAYLLAKRPGVKRVLLFDPLAEEYAHAHWHAKKFSLAPDPLSSETLALRPLSAGDRIADRPVRFLLAGALNHRKGLHLMVDALDKSSPETKRDVFLSIVGKPENGAEEYVQRNLGRLKEMGVSVFTDLRFISDRELEQHLSETHIVLTPYVGFKGSSGLLTHAAHFGKPVISTNDGLLGYLVPKHGLGEAINVEDPAVFADCLDRIVLTGTVQGFAPATARAFADSCSPEVFANTLLVSPE